MLLTHMHMGAVQSSFKRLQQQGRLTEQTIEQLYSEALGKFLADRFVRGTCPNADCQFEVRAASCCCAVSASCHVI